jgi:hypothetical protein
MLDEHNTPRRYWVEAVNTAGYVGNQIFLRAFMKRHAMSSCMGEHLE